MSVTFFVVGTFSSVNASLRMLLYVSTLRHTWIVSGEVVVFMTMVYAI